MLAQGLVLLVAGMGFVFAFLLLLVLTMLICAKIIPRFNYVLPDAAPKAAPQVPVASDDSAVALAIAVALKR